MNWGHKVTIAFILFAIIIITMVTISMRQDVNLVATDYYKEEIAYQEQIDRIQNFNQLTTKPDIYKAESNLVVNFPNELAGTIIEGELHLYRPSKAGLDKRVKLTLNQSNQHIYPLPGIKKGLWKVKLKWKTSDKEYFKEQSIII